MLKYVWREIDFYTGPCFIIRPYHIEFQMYHYFLCTNGDAVTKYFTFLFSLKGMEI